MDYEQFITEIQKYWDLRKKGLKKQANSFLFTFTKTFKEFEYYVRLYQIYFAWQRNNRKGDFYELCEKEGLAFKRIPVIYYKS